MCQIDGLDPRALHQRHRRASARTVARNQPGAARHDQRHRRQRRAAPSPRSDAVRADALPCRRPVRETTAPSARARVPRPVARAAPAPRPAACARPLCSSPTRQRTPRALASASAVATRALPLRGLPTWRKAGPCALPSRSGGSGCRLGIALRHASRLNIPPLIAAFCTRLAGSGLPPHQHALAAGRGQGARRRSPRRRQRLSGGGGLNFLGPATIVFI